MGRKAWMRYARAVCGVSQLELANAVGVRVLTVKRWEKPGEAEPPDDVVEYLWQSVEAHERDVADLVGRCLAGAEAGDAVALDWYRDQGQADLDGLGVPFSYQNAVVRDVARKLSEMGVDVVIRFPDEEIAGMAEG